MASLYFCSIWGSCWAFQVAIVVGEETEQDLYRERSTYYYRWDLVSPASHSTRQCTFTDQSNQTKVYDKPRYIRPEKSKHFLRKSSHMHLILPHKLMKQPHPSHGLPHPSHGLFHNSIHCSHPQNMCTPHYPIVTSASSLTCHSSLHSTPWPPKDCEFWPNLFLFLSQLLALHQWWSRHGLWQDQCLVSSRFHPDQQFCVVNSKMY